MYVYTLGLYTNKCYQQIQECVCVDLNQAIPISTEELSSDNFPLKS